MNMDERLKEAIDKDDAVLLYRAVCDASADEVRTFTSKFADTFRALDGTQRDVFRGLVAVHGEKLDDVHRVTVRTIANG